MKLQRDLALLYCTQSYAYKQAQPLKFSASTHVFVSTKTTAWLNYSKVKPDQNACPSFGPTYLILISFYKTSWTTFISVTEAKLFLHVIKYHGINALARMEVKFHAFLTPLLDVGEFSTSCLCPLIPGKEALMRTARVAACAQGISGHLSLQ
jgi:hypothetical protein